MKSVLNKAILVTTLAVIFNPLAFADGNTAYGVNASAAITSGDNNTHIGENSGKALTSGHNTTFVGFNTGSLNTGSDNIFIGAQAGEVNITGNDNTFIGTLAGLLSTGTDNTFVGTEAGGSNTTGNDNTFIGEESGFKNTDGDDNVFIGEDSGYQNTLGHKNTFIGASAGAGYPSSYDTYELTGSYNSALGYYAGNNFEGTSTANTGIGAKAGYDIGEGLGNTMLGAFSGENTEHADFNTFVGTAAGWDNNRTNETDIANRNTALGSFAGYANRKGEDNVWIGAFSNSQNSLYSYTTELETNLLSGWTTNGPGGNDNVFRTTVLGAFAGANDNDSIAIGYGAIADKVNTTVLGTSASAKGTADIVIGAQASSNHTEAIAIGYQATTRADYTVTLGNDNTQFWEPSLDGVTSLGKAKHCYYDDERGGSYEWECEPMYRFSDVVSYKFSAIAADTQMVEIDLWADNGDDFADQWSLSAADDGNFSIASYVNSSSRWNSETRVKTDLLTIANNGDVTVAGGLTLNSDKRLKQNINDITNAFELLEQINGVTYHWKEDLGRSTEKQYGLIAQNVEAILPELVKSDDKGIKSVNYQALIPVLINASKEQQKQISVQSALIAKQQKQIEQLMQLVSSK